MGLPCFSKVLKYGCLAVIGLAAAFAAIAVLSSPATAAEGGGENKNDSYPWDTDNLRYGSYSARSFNVPFHQYGGYSETACQSGVADGFFQAGGSVGAVNDFPYLEWKSSGDSGSWVEKEGGTRSKGCDEFVEQQDEMVSQIVGNGGYYLDLSGKLQKLDSMDIPSRFSGRSLVYGDWDEKGDGFAINGSTGEVSYLYDENGYLARVDGRQIIRGNSRDYSRAIYPSGTTWTVPERTQDGRFGSGWHGTRSGNSVRVARPVISGGYLPNDPELCPYRFHPRGEDSVDRIGGSTGRTLSGLTHAIGMTADMYWCRSDLRFARAFETQNHGVALHPDAVNMSGAFQSYGRLNCYYTAFTDTSHETSNTKGIHQDTSSGGMVCSYLFPVPKCDPDTDNNSDTDWRDYKAKELKDIATDLGTGKFNKDEGEACPPAASAPPSSTPRLNAASFSVTACVTATLSIYENRVRGSDAEPGIVSGDMTLTVASGRTAWDLDITSPHPATASPPRETSDASGCADGSEERAGHSSSPAGAARKQVPAPSYAASDRTNTAAPPNDADGDIDYSGAAKNMAHRYASKIAENTCAAKRAEAVLRLEMLEAEANIYKDWMARYNTWAQDMETKFSDWLDDNPALSTSSADNPTFGSYKHAVRRGFRRTYASGMQAFYAGRKTRSASVAGWALPAKPSMSSSWCADVTSHIRTYANSVTALKTAATNVISYGSAARSPASGPSAPVVSPSSAPSSGYISSSDEGTKPEPAVYETTYHNNSYCHTSGNLPTSKWAYGTWVTYSYGGSCTKEVDDKTVSGTTVTVSYTTRTLKTVAVAEVKATATATYNSYILRLSSGTWSKSATVPSATGSAACSSWRTSSCYVSGTHPLHSRYVAWYTGVTAAPVDFPTITASPSNGAFTNISIYNLLGRYYPEDSARTGLKNASASVRNTTATALGTLTATATAGEGTLPAAFSVSAIPRTSQNATASTANAERSQINTAATTWRNAYTRAYNTAYTQATGHMSGTSWDSFDWRYETSTLVWSGYQEDSATAYSASTATPRDGTGCDLVNVAADGTVTVEATRLDYEGTSGSPPASSRYGVGNTISVRTASQRECKIRRVRSPELLLMYAPSATDLIAAGVDTSKTADTRLDTDIYPTNAEFYYVDYQPTAADEQFKLYDEAEVFAVRVSLADRAPVLCYQPGEALVAHVGAKGIDAVNEAVFRHASGFRGGSKKHCFKHPSPAQPAFAFFDDTAHSAMASVTAVWQQPSPKIVSKLGSTDHLKMMGDSVSLVASTAVPYNDSARTSSFYGTYYTFPADTSTKSPSGWNISRHPTLTLTSEFRQHAVQAKDTTTRTPAATHQMAFKFIDCVFGIEDVAFVDNIASPYAFLSTKNEAGVRVVPQGWKQTYDSDPHNSPTWYYPPFSTYQGALRLDGRRDSNGDPIVYRRNPQGGFPHPSYDLENTSADGIGWGILYENTVGKQQPVWAVYAPPVPGDNNAA